MRHSADKTVTVASLSILWECSHSVAEETLNFKYCNYTMKRKHKEHMREPTWLQHFHLNVLLFHSSTHCILPLAIQHSSWSAAQQLFLAHHSQMNNNNARDYCSKSVWWGARHTNSNQVQDQDFHPLQIIRCKMSLFLICTDVGSHVISTVLHSYCFFLCYQLVVSLDVACHKPWQGKGGVSILKLRP